MHLSVLLPVRNAGPHLRSSLDSLWRQTLRDFEVVAVDDGSTDGSAERLEREARSERRLRVLRRSAAGLPAALNAALAAARGELVARHDADDLSHPLRLELQRDRLVRDEAIAVVGCRLRLLPRGFAGVGMRRWVAWHNALLDHEEMAREVLVDSPLAHASAMMRRAALERAGGWRELGWPEDLDLWIRLLRQGERFLKLPRVLYAWRQHAASATRRDPRNRQDRFDALRLHALDTGPLLGASTVQVVGVGRSLARWEALLSAAGRPVRATECRRPGAGFPLEPPAVMVFGAVEARSRWRSALASSGLREGTDFVFVA